MGRRKKQDEWDGADKLKVIKEYQMSGGNAFIIRSANLNYSGAFKMLPGAGIFQHSEGVELLPANIEMSGMAARW